VQISFNTGIASSEGLLPIETRRLPHAGIPPVCSIEDHRFAVREGNELLPGAAMARDQKGVMCDRATYGAYINLSLSSQP
jgi:hypothetical protein